MIPARKPAMVGAWRAIAGAAAAAASACALSAGDAAAPRPAPPTGQARLPAVGPPRYFVVHPDAFIERTREGVEYIVAGGARIEMVEGRAARAMAEPQLDGGRAVPPWLAVRAGAARYVFWRGKDVFAASAFTDAPRKIASLPSDVTRAFPWFDGVGVFTNVGGFSVRDGGTRVAPLGVAGAMAAIAGDPRRGVVLTAFGHALVSVDGGSKWIDKSAEIGGGNRLELRGDDIAVGFKDGRERFVGASGDIADVRGAGSFGRARSIEDDPWRVATGTSALSHVSQDATPIANDTAVIVADGRVGRVDLRTGRGSVVGELPYASLECAPIRLGRSLLLACADQERAMVLDATASLRVERTFDRLGDLDRFVGDDDTALGFVGRCGGGPKRVPGADVVTSASAANLSNQHSAAFCVRVTGEQWVEHELDPADAADVVAWVPRPDGAAVALVARAGNAVRDEPRVTQRGSLRVVRVARGEPPLSIYTDVALSPRTLVRDLAALPDGTIEGWFPSGSRGHGTSIRIDGEGRAQQRALPYRTSTLTTAGRYAVALTDDRRLLETTDRGASWHDIAPPPGGPASPSSCSAVGCEIGAFVRVGWAEGVPPRSAEPVPPGAAHAPPPATRGRGGRSPARPAVAHLSCRFAAPPTAARIPDSYGFGITPAPVSHPMSPIRLGTVGVLAMPFNGSAVASDVEAGFVPPLDLAAPVKRATIPAATAATIAPRRRIHEARLGYVFRAQDGRVDLVATGTEEQCAERLLEAAGVVRRMSGCVSDATVGVDLGASLVLLSPRADEIELSAFDEPATPRSRGASATGDVAAPLLRVRRVVATPSGVRNLSFGVGARHGAAVAVAVQGDGTAVLAPIDLDHGGFDAEQPLVALTDLVPMTDPRCRSDTTDEARVVLPFDTAIGVADDGLPGIVPTGTGGVAIIRWSAARACLEAVELGVRDERYEQDPGPYEPPGTVRKLIARFDRAKGSGTLVAIGPGFELRQALQCGGGR